MDESVLAQALRESEELHRVTLLSMSDAVFITNDDGAFTFICPNVDVIFGYGEDEYAPWSASRGFSVGLVSMRERVSQVEGQMTLTSTLNEGTRIELRVPLRAAGV